MANIIKIDNAELKRRRKKEQRKKKEIFCRILIVCEGEKTEPQYFEAFNTVNNTHFAYVVNAQGFGLNTIDVVNKAIELRSDSYDAIWAVFDRDDFSADKFNGAIAKAEANNINVAWSNEAFELWYLLHFQYRNVSMSREDYKSTISEAVNIQLPKSKRGYKYRKNDPNNYSIMLKYGSMNDAIANADKLMELFTDKNYYTHNPCTTVHKLVLQLLNKDEKLIKDVMDRINTQP